MLLNHRSPHRYALVLLMAMMTTVACKAERSEPIENQPGFDVDRLKADLESGLAVPRQEPFVLRSFRPYLGDNWIGNAVAYSGYRKGQAPGRQGPSNEELLEDLEIVSKHWQLIRVYGADGDTRRVLQIIDEYGLPIKVIQGIWLMPEEDPLEREANINSVLLGIELANQYPDIVIAVSVANETQVFWSGHQMRPENLIRYIRIVRNHVTVPVTTADDYLYWNKPESRQVATETDFVFTHIHPLWNEQKLKDAITWFDQTYRQVQELHADRTIVIAETGWATDYNAAKTGPGEQGSKVKGAVGLDAQADFLLQLNRWIDSSQVTTFLFEVFDESWKGGGENSPPNEIEKHWGVFNEDRTPKESFSKFLAHIRSAQD